jgi:feruloyl esterase
MSASRFRAWRVLAWSAAAVVLAGAVPRAQSAFFRDWKSSSLAGSDRIAPHLACQALVSLTSYDISVTSATVVPASSDAPEFCRVSGLIQPEIRFELALPASWNGRLYMLGNGGYAGEPLDSTMRQGILKRALAHGFATAQTNTGHDAAVEPLGTFAVSPQKFLDYAYRAVHITAVTAKQIAQAYYDGAPKRAYFVGCSTGGRQGLISAQRFPDDFDGIVVGAPVLNFSGTMIGYVAIQRALAAAPIAPEQLKVVADAVYATCDATDGVKDGLIDDPRRCAFKPSADLPKCAGDAQGPGCFTTAQLDALEAIYRPVVRNGVELFPGWPVGAEGGWDPWLLTKGRPVQANFGETFFRYLAFSRPNPSYDWLTFNADADFDKILATRTALDAVDPDLSRFKARGGKIVSYFGWADPALNPMMGVNYYERVLDTMGSSTTDFYRMFMVPGMFHCAGGVGTDSFDPITPLVEWVEKGVAPASIPAARIADGKVVRSRPLCPYPETAVYKGSGSVDEAASFSSAAPKGAASR